MKFAIAIHGTRGDIEPCAALGLELQNRGHEVRIAVPPNLLDFVRSAGLTNAVAYGPDSQKQLEGDVFTRPDALTAATPADWAKLGNPLTALRKAREAATAGWSEMSTTLSGLADGADLILTGIAYQEIVANVAESAHLPMAEVHYFPVRANTTILPVRVPPALVRRAWAVGEWMHWRLLRPAEADQRRTLGLPTATRSAVRRILDRRTLEIQAYDKVFFPALAEEWGDRRPLIGSMTLQMPTDLDSEVDAWIAAGDPPVYFGFGSMPIEDPAASIRMLTEVCADLGVRALIGAGVSALGIGSQAEHIKVVPALNHAAVFPRCRAVVHHGGAGTTAAGVRAGVPTLVLWVAAEQPLWGKQIQRLGIGRSRRFSETTHDTLREDLHAVLSPECARRAREISQRMTSASESVATAADLLEHEVRVEASG